VHFASIIAHDLNAPLRSLHDVIDEFESADPAIDERRSFSRIRTHVERMKNILDGMRDYLQALCLGPVTRPVNVAALVREIVETLPDRRGFGLELSLKTEEILVHIGLFDLVLRNLLDNAIKHHDRKCGNLRVSLDEESDAWLIGIEDDGPGISLAERNALRDGRIQVAPGERSVSEGNGLPIVKRALDAIGGKINVHSNPARERGTRFVIRWPKGPSCSPDTA
jgi:signal transduction histidine kinase